MKKNIRISFAYLLGAIASFAVFAMVKSHTALWLSGFAMVTFMILSHISEP
jgi:hypothetical protein